MLSDKDPMLGSASNQFCLPVLDSNDPNFQMPCSTVVGLDDIMDEGVVKESGNDTIDEEELILPNRSLRDRVEDNSVRSPRKSPRLMAQEQVRSLRQSTIAKRSNATPLSTKKPSGKTLSTSKVGVKPPERCQGKEEVYASLKSEHPKESRRSGRHAEQMDVAPEVSASSVDSSVSSCVGMKEEAEFDPKHACNNQGEVNVPSPELDCPLLSETSASVEEKSIEALMECKAKTNSSPLYKFPVREDEQSDLVSRELNDTIEGKDAGGKPDQESEEVKFPGEGGQMAEEAESSDMSSDSTCTDKNKAEKNQGTECHLELKNTVDIIDNPENSPQRNQLETLGYGEDTESNDAQLQSTEFNKSDLEGADTCEPEASTLENTICDVLDQNSKQLNITQSIKMETANLQDDRSGLEPKNTKPKHVKSVTHSKQSTTTEAPRKTVAAKHEVGHSKTKSNVKAVKRNSDEPEPQPDFQRPVKVRKKQVDKDLKSQSCNSGVKSVKSQAHSVLKKIPQDQNAMQISKPLTHSHSDKLHGHSGFSKEPHHPVQTGHLVHSSQKQSHKLQQQAVVAKVSSHVKDEHDHPVSEHLKEDDKLKPKKPDRNLQPRQRRSSRSFSLDEPPLFIPDNIATIKKEGSDQTTSIESKYMWTPSKQCGFCKKPHGNRFMVGCGRCDDWFHGDCVGLSLSQAQQMGEEDKEYVCVRCCAEEDKKTDILDTEIFETQAPIEAHSEDKRMECGKLTSSKHALTDDKHRHSDDPGKHKVKILKRESGEGKTSSDSRDNEIKKWQLAPLRKLGQPHLPRRSSEEKSEKIAKESAALACTGERAARSGTHEKQETKKKKVEKGGPHVPPPAAAASKPSADQIRQSVRHSLKDILMKRLTDSNLKIPEEKAAKVATKIEKELFSFFRDTDAKYKNKYRSLMFNLKDPKNNILFKKVLKGEVTPDHLIRMSPEELASKELAAWRRRENRHTIEMIEKEQREVERRPITKITHKGEIEIESDAPMKEQEAAMEIQEPSANKSLEKPDTSEKQKEEVDPTSRDTTSQHRQHLFDLNCKICIGRMAPPIDDLSPKTVKVVVGGARKHSDNEAESLADALSSTSNILASDFFEEEKQESPKSTFSPTPRPEMPGTVEVESTFLARLNFIWKGFINMPSVAKFVTKAYPVSGSPEYLTEDLPDSIQVGGRISPQTVWDYVEKIKASGTKEICVVRFTPVTEEDQISYTLLFAYFSSRKRYGVAANNMKQVKDMYLIPLGSADKIPHPLVPFDGPGLELHRPNLLLGLIIRQKLKRQHSASAGPSHTAETPEGAPIALPPDKKGKMESCTEEAAEEESDFFNSFTTVLHKQRNKPPQPLQEDLPTTAEPLMEVTKQEPPKPLRFLPGVLIGWDSQPSTLELANKPLPVDDILHSLLGTTAQYEQAQPLVEQNTLKEIPFINDQANPKVEKTDKVEVTEGEAKEIKVKAENTSVSTSKNSGVEETSLVGSSSISPGPLASLSLRGKPPDVSTEAFLTNLSIPSKQEETVENKERTLKRPLLQDQENSLQDNRTSSNSPCWPSTGKGGMDGDGSGSSSESLVANTRAPQFINLKRDPRQAAGRSQQTASESKDAESCRNGEKHAASGPPHNKEPLAEPVSGEGKLPSLEKSSCVEQNHDSEAAPNSSEENLNSSQAEQANPSQEDIFTQNIETVHPFRRGSATTSSHFEGGNTCQSEFPSKSINFTCRSSSPRASTNFSPMRPPQPNLQHLKTSPPGFPFPGPQNFPPQSVFGFPPHLPPPLLPPPGFGFPQNPPMVPWPPVHVPGQPQRMMGPLSQASRYMGPQNFYQVKDIRRPERRHSDPWGRQDQQQPDRPFNRGKGDRQRFYSDSHHLKRERHDKDWEQESERHRHRDRSQERDRDRKSKEEAAAHKDKERPRLAHGDRAPDGKASRDGKNADKKPDRLKGEDPEKEKERDKNKHREGEKDRERYHKDRDHTDRAKSKR
ncbi:PHD finger protein 3 isoform X2 [Mus pahari]|nr:PHD finger protein 3 isoform X2 [Mus pahari]